MAHASFKLLLASVALAGLAGCSKEPAKEDYKADVTDKSGGQIIVEDATPEPQGVKLPETPMTPAPDASESTAPAK